MSNTKKIIGFDIGASKIRWAVFESSEIRKNGIIRIDKNINDNDIVDIICKIAIEHNINTIGVAIAGFVTNAKVLHMPNLTNVIDEFELQKRVEARINGRCFVENDVKCMALAQWWGLKNKDNANFVLVAPGSGIGGAIVIDGKLIRGANNTAGEFGHMKLALSSTKMQLPVEWENISSGRGIEKSFTDILRGKDILATKYIKKMTAKEILNSESILCKRITRQAAYFFGLNLANIANAINPEVIYLAGSVSQSYLSAKTNQIVKNVFLKNTIISARNTKIMACSLQTPALIGAILLTKKENNSLIKKFLS